MDGTPEGSRPPRSREGSGNGSPFGSRVGATVEPIVADPAELSAALTRAASVVESALDALLPPEEGAEARLATSMRYATLGGGKRMRAFLVMEGAALFSVSETCAARVAASIEMLHAYSLSTTTCRRWTTTILGVANLQHIGPSMRPRRFWLATHCRLVRSKFWRNQIPTRIRRRAASWWRHWGPQPARAAWRRTDDRHAGGRPDAGRTRGNAAAGAEDRPADPVQRRGWRHPGARGPDAAHLLAAYGRDLGAAFQIADDLLDAEGSAEETGKRTGRTRKPEKQRWWPSWALPGHASRPTC